MIVWYQDVASFAATVSRLRPECYRIEDELASRASMDGYCVNCARVVELRLDIGVFMGEYRNYREGAVCVECGCTGRARLLLEGILETVTGCIEPAVCALEAASPFASALRKRFPRGAFSEYFGGDVQAGALCEYRQTLVRHEDVTRLSYEDGRFDIVCHNDVLEHVYDYRQAMREIARVLRPGGWMVASFPFFYDLPHTLQRGRIEPDGQLTHLLPPEYHGDGLRSEGIYTFYHFGLDVLADLAAAGFDRVEVGLCYDPFRGYLSNNFRYDGHGYMLPTLLRSRRACI